jgi:hypothetical protein
MIAVPVSNNWYVQLSKTPIASDNELNILILCKKLVSAIHPFRGRQGKAVKLLPFSTGKWDADQWAIGLWLAS